MRRYNLALILKLLLALSIVLANVLTLGRMHPDLAKKYRILSHLINLITALSVIYLLSSVVRDTSELLLNGFTILAGESAMSIAFSIGISLLILILSTAVSFLRGFLIEAISLAYWIMSFVVALYFTPGVDIAQLAINTGFSPELSLAVVFLSMTVASFVILSFFAPLLSSLVNYDQIRKSAYGDMDELFGAVFGFLRGVFVIALVHTLHNRVTRPESDFTVVARIGNSIINTIIRFFSQFALQ